MQEAKQYIFIVKRDELLVDMLELMEVRILVFVADKKSNNIIKSTKDCY